jgi:hypothetical protein
MGDKGKSDSQEDDSSSSSKKKWTKAPKPKNGTGNLPGRPSKYKPEFCEHLIAHMKQGESFWSYASVIEVCLQTLQEWTDPRSPHFKPEFLEAKKKGEAHLLRYDESVGSAGILGNLKFITEKSELPDGTTIEKITAAKFAATAYIFRMKNRYPQLYRDRIENVLTDPDGKPVSSGPTVIINIPSNGRETKG